MQSTGRFRATRGQRGSVLLVFLLFLLLVLFVVIVLVLVEVLIEIVELFVVKVFVEVFIFEFVEVLVVEVIGIVVGIFSVFVLVFFLLPFFPFLTFVVRLLPGTHEMRTGARQWRRKRRSTELESTRLEQDVNTRHQHRQDPLV